MAEGMDGDVKRGLGWRNCLFHTRVFSGRLESCHGSELFSSIARDFSNRIACICGSRISCD